MIPERTRLGQIVRDQGLGNRQPALLGEMELPRFVGGRRVANDVVYPQALGALPHALECGGALAHRELARVGFHPPQWNTEGLRPPPPDGSHIRDPKVPPIGTRQRERVDARCRQMLIHVHPLREIDEIQQHDIGRSESLQCGDDAVHMHVLRF